MILDSTHKFNPPSSIELFVTILSLAVALALLVWSLHTYQPPPPPTIYGSRAIYSIIVLSIILALLGRFLLLYAIKRESGVAHVLYHLLPSSWQALFLFDVTAPIYLAAGVLVDVPSGVLTVLITQAVLQAVTWRRGFVSLAEAAYRVAATAVVVLISDDLFAAIAGSQRSHGTSHFSPLVESNELLGCILAAIVMLLLLVLTWLPSIIRSRSSEKSYVRPDETQAVSVPLWKAVAVSPAFRFQALVLSVGPLLPVVDIFDNTRAEVAWLFFLVPLFAIYYLALVSSRLSIRTDTLQDTLVDLKSARRRQDELRDYATLVTRVQEEERRRLARELHDDTAQALIALALGLDGLGRAIGQLDLTQRDKEWLASLQNLAEHTLEGVRRACRDLRPSVLDDLGLRAALEWLSDSSSARGVPCQFICRGVVQPIAPENEIAIFRITQEALSNIWRHSRATQASIELAYLPEQLRLSIHDNGRGIVPDDSTGAAHTRDPQGGLGLSGMRERAALIGATLKITSSSGNGCHIELLLPILTPPSLKEQSATV